MDYMDDRFNRMREAYAQRDAAEQALREAEAEIERLKDERKSLFRQFAERMYHPEYFENALRMRREWFRRCGLVPDV